MSLFKKCRDCNKIKPLEKFHKNKGMKDGRLNSCMECRNLYRKTYDDKNFESRKRPYNAKNHERYLCSLRLYRNKWPEKYKATNKVSNAIRDKRLTKEPCAICGEKEVQAHHVNYSKPLEVTWLCFKHHRLLHGNRNV
jgi:hypothetical protein